MPSVRELLEQYGVIRLLPATIPPGFASAADGRFLKGGTATKDDWTALVKGVWDQYVTVLKERGTTELREIERYLVEKEEELTEKVEANRDSRRRAATKCLVEMTEAGHVQLAEAEIEHLAGWAALGVGPQFQRFCQLFDGYYDVPDEPERLSKEHWRLIKKREIQTTFRIGARTSDTLHVISFRLAILRNVLWRYSVFGELALFEQLPDKTTSELWGTLTMAEQPEPSPTDVRHALTCIDALRRYQASRGGKLERRRFNRFLEAEYELPSIMGKAVTEGTRRVIERLGGEYDGFGTSFEPELVRLSANIEDLAVTHDVTPHPRKGCAHNSTQT